MERKSLRIRTIAEGDRAGLVDLWTASWRQAMPTIDFEARRGWIASFLAAPDYTTLVAENRGIVGFVSLRGSILHQLVVAPVAKGTGAAQALLEAAKAFAPDGLELEVNKDNARAVAFYRREGFVQVGESSNPNSGLATWRMSWRALSGAAL